MLKKLKRTLIIGCAAALLLGTTAFATIYSYSFHFTNSQKANNTSAAQKTDSLNYFGFSMTSGDLWQGQESVTLKGQDYNYNDVTQSFSSSYYFDSHTVPYFTQTPGQQYDYYRLRGEYSGNYINCSVNGAWEP